VDEDQEGGLKGILSVMVVTKDTTADAPDCCTIPMHEGGKSRLIAAPDVFFQQLSDSQARPVLQ